MKKKILFGVVALVTVFVFTGCDKILEFMFPDFADSGDYNLTVVVNLLDTEVDWDGHDVVVEAFRTTTSGELKTVGGSKPRALADDVTTESVGILRGRLQWYDDFPTTTFNFWGLKEGSYSVRAWLDLNNNNTPDTDEAFGQTDTVVLSPTSQTAELVANLNRPVAPPSANQPYAYVVYGYADRVSAYGYFQVEQTISGLVFDSIEWQVTDGYNVLATGTQDGSNYITADLYEMVAVLSYGEGTYYFRVVNAMAGGVSIPAWQLDVPFQMAGNAGSPLLNQPYQPVVEVTNLEAWPHFLDTGATYGVRISYVDGTYATVHETFTSVYFDGYTLRAYDDLWWYSVRMAWSDPSFAGYIVVKIDTNNDTDFVDDMDLAALQIVSLFSWEPDQSGVYWPTISIDAPRFIPEVDFSRMSGL